MWKEVWDNHKGKLVGIVIGIFHGFIYLYFGFWNMLFFALVVFTGFHLGRQMDRGEPFFNTRPWIDWLTERWNMFK